ncbi:MAG: hypothetical protein K6E75_12830 [Lachnospiraceae bacterium]|nr:hypothetical protein [Lachnospiraceae bacterium]
MGSFSFLEAAWKDLAELGNLAEKYVYDDPNSSITKQGMLAEAMVRYLLRYNRISEPETDNTHANRIFLLQYNKLLPQEIDHILNTLRIARNKAVHDAASSRSVAERNLQDCLKLCRWFCNTYSGNAGGSRSNTAYTENGQQYTASQNTTYTGSQTGEKWENVVSLFELLIIAILELIIVIKVIPYTSRPSINSVTSILTGILYFVICLSLYWGDKKLVYKTTSVMLVQILLLALDIAPERDLLLSLMLFVERVIPLPLLEVIIYQLLTKVIPYWLIFKLPSLLLKAVKKVLVKN